MKKVIKPFFCLFITLNFIANVPISFSKNQTNPWFNLKKSNRQLELVSKKLESRKINTYKLENNIAILEQLHESAESCIDHVKAKLSTINKIFKNGLSSHDSKNPDYLYIQKKKQQFTHYLSECRYFTFRTNEILVSAKEKLHRLTTHELLKKSTPIWQALTHWSSVNLDYESILQSSGIMGMHSSMILIGILIIGFIFFFSKVIFKHIIKHTIVKKQRPIKIRALKVLYVFIPYILTTGIVSVLLLIFFYSGKPLPTVVHLTYSLFVYSIALAVLSFLFHPYFEKEKFNIFKIPTYINQILYRRLRILASYILIGYLGFYIFGDQMLSTPLEELIRSIYVILLSISMFWAIWPVLSLPHLQNKSFIIGFTKSLFFVLLMSTIILECLGFHHLVVYFIYSFILSVVLFFITWFVFTYIEHAYSLFESKHSKFSKKLHRILGVKPHRRLTEVLLIKFSLYLVLICVFTIYFMEIWNIPSLYIDTLEKSLLDGFELSGITIIPSRLVFGLLIFSFLNLAGRFIATRIAKTHHFEGEADTQVAIASIFSYVGFSVALVIALMISGFNFTGLAIIVGALSVGIGLGLQNIVNNFISGIILLLEKPIKPGDRIIVGDTEGYVNKIRVRSTQIRTLAREDVIVPNSDLITNQVTNYMFRDHYWRVSCQVGVAYGSDTELVKNVLLDVAKSHPSVVIDSLNPPVVLFRAFGDSSLNFELWCIIKDVNKKYHVMSDLNFAIDQAFRKNNITIAFPQRDIHIKSDPKIDPS